MPLPSKGTPKISRCSFSRGYYNGFGGGSALFGVGLEGSWHEAGFFNIRGSCFRGPDKKDPVI